MSFLHPEFIYYMMPLVFVLFYFLLTQREKQADFFSEEVLSKLRVNTNMMTLRARNALMFIMMISLILALAQPVIEEGSVKVEAKSADIMVALDISDSMLAQDMYPSRLLSAQEKIVTLLKDAKQSRIGVIAFAGVSYLVSPLSLDHGAVRFLVEQLHPSSITQKGTDILQLLENADNIFGDSKHKNLLILSDGGDESDFSREIEYAKEHNIKVFVLGMGTNKGAPIPTKDGSFMKYDGDIVISKLNENIKKLATSTGGVYIQATSSQQDIKAMIKEMDSTLEKETIKDEYITQYLQLFYIPLGIGMFLLLIATSSLRRRESVTVPLLLAALLHPSSSDALLLDFLDLDDAKQAYEKGEYKKSAQLYDEYATKHNGNNEALYNEASSLYKAKKYKEAIEKFGSVKSTDPELTYRSLHNIGNSYALSNEKDSLENAIKSYEEALKIKEDAETRKNLEEVRKKLKEQQKKKQKEQNKNQQKQNKEQNQKDNQDQKNDQQQSKSDEQNKKSSDKQEQNNKKESKDKESDNKESNKKEQDQQKESQDSKNSKSKKEKQEEQKSQESQKEQSKKQDEQNMMQNAQEGFDMNESMSQREQKKWLKMLNENQRTHLYKLEPREPKQRRENEKPW